MLLQGFDTPLIDAFTVYAREYDMEKGYIFDGDDFELKRTAEEL